MHLTIRSGVLGAAILFLVACEKDGGTGAGGQDTGTETGTETSADTGEDTGTETVSDTGEDTQTDTTFWWDTDSMYDSDGNVLDQTYEQFCGGSGPIVIPGQNICTQDLAKKVFGFAICSCSDLTSGQVIRTDSTNPALAGEVLSGGSVGVNGSYHTTSTNEFHGAFYVGGSSYFGNGHVIDQDFWCQDTAYVGAVATVGRDAHIGGLLTCGTPGNLQITGNLYSQVVENGDQATYDGWSQASPVVVPQPCDCTDPVDVGAIVAAFADRNDNAHDEFHVIQTNAFTKNPSLPVDITLPCGRYYFEGFNVNNPVTIRLEGRTVIALEGDIHTSGLLTIALEGADAELDLFVSGDFDLNAPAIIGRADAPRATRIYIGGDSVIMSGNFDLSANLYMPYATFQVMSDLDMSGALFANSLQNTGAISVHFDEGILEMPGCKPPGTPCESCGDCVNPRPACTADGICGPCTADQDCCPPLHCDVEKGGICVPRPVSIE